jgi:hypothetical protein
LEADDGDDGGGGGGGGCRMGVEYIVTQRSDPWIRRKAAERWQGIRVELASSNQKKDDINCNLTAP